MVFKKLQYYNFKISHIIKHWIKKRFTTAGFFVQIALIVTAVVGVNTYQTVAYEAFTLLFFLLFLSLLSGPFFNLNIDVERKISRFATVGEPLRYKIVVKNRSSKVQSGLLLVDTLADPSPSYEEFIHGKVTGEEKRNWLDRILGYPKWVGLTLQKILARTTEQKIPPIPPNDQVEIETELIPIRRGYLVFTSVTVARPDPFGLFKSFKTIPFGDTVLILPKRYPMPDIELPGNLKHQPRGIKLATSVGESEDFISLRDYQLGDSLRRIHWRSWAKVGKPVVKEYQDEFFVRHALILDTFTEYGYSEKFEEAVSVASSFALSFRTQDSLLDLVFVGPQFYSFTTGRGTTQTEKILEILATVKTCTDKPFEILHRSVMERISLLSGCICIFISWDDARQKFVEEMQRYQVPIVVFVIRDAQGKEKSKPGTLSDNPGCFYELRVGKIAEGLGILRQCHRFF